MHSPAVEYSCKCAGTISLMIRQVVGRQCLVLDPYTHIALGLVCRETSIPCVSSLSLFSDTNRIV